MGACFVAEERLETRGGVVGSGVALKSGGTDGGIEATHAVGKQRLEPVGGVVGAGGESLIGLGAGAGVAPVLGTQRRWDRRRGDEECGEVSEVIFVFHGAWSRVGVRTGGGDWSRIRPVRVVLSRNSEVVSSGMK